ncbi:cytokine receptor-like factor 2 [Microcebus murinus]|uniref:cytokine receptor-like factor 2 n=1 Tax=Microcebus murinus TaxID=30608 RepID=UPI003F6CDE16
MRGSLLPWAAAAAAVCLLGRLMALGTAGTGEALQVHIICFNFETVRVTWNASEPSGENLTFFYTFDSGEAYGQCTHYILRRGLTAGCILDFQDRVLHFSIRNATHALFTHSQWASFYLKPGAPRNLSFQWQQEKVAVTCPGLAHGGLLYEVQLRSNFDAAWQSKEEETCNVHIEGLDAEKCYCLRARVKTMEAAYGPDSYPGDWSEVSCWYGGLPSDLCPDVPFSPGFPRFILICSLVALLTLCLVLLSLWKLGRVRNLLVPTVPDPKSSFSGLFEQHQGNFQEWMKDAQNVAHLPRTGSGGGELDCGPEEALVVQVAKTATALDSLSRSSEEGQPPGGCSQLFRRPPQSGPVVSLGGFEFVMSDGSYVML